MVPETDFFDPPERIRAIGSGLHSRRGSDPDLNFDTGVRIGPGGRLQPNLNNVVRIRHEGEGDSRIRKLAAIGFILLSAAIRLPRTMNPGCIWMAEFPSQSPSRNRHCLRLFVLLF